MLANSRTLTADSTLDTEAIPAAVYFNLHTMDGIPVVVCDTETTSLNSKANLTQLAASTLSHQPQFKTYVVPDRDISAAAQEVTGLRVAVAKWPPSTSSWDWATLCTSPQRCSQKTPSLAAGKLP